ncbi:hypothetical protein DMENIID0001_163930 [Sergentomyia squamirostris]
MINVTVKTLDSQNHQFTVEEEITVRQFKEHIAEKVSVDADLQRIIYCGRLLKDEKLLKEYDVNGKVVHLVQRPPPSTRTATTTTETTPQNRWRVRNLNTRSPLIRAIDGMVLGAMAIPMNTNNGTPQAAAPSLNPSSTLCMNRITVARHMLECANNIARFLENPEGGLNNAAMDDLAQQTLESTVFEVGISAVGEVDIPQMQMQNLVHAFQGAVTAALRQNGVPNIRMMQQPTTASGGASAEGAEAVPAVEIAEDITLAVGGTPQAQSSGSTTQTPSSENTSTESTPNGQSSRSRQQTTRTQTLATVVQQMRDVQTRLEPFVQQYYDILESDPTYETEDERNNAQRIFDHVSEAFHYISHALHAISDLMLCLSSNTPRHLCCRPILVEQSAILSSGFTVPANLITVTRPVQNNNQSPAGASAPTSAQSENNNASTEQYGDSQASQRNTGDQGLGPQPSGQSTNEQSDEDRRPGLIPRNLFSLFVPIPNRPTIRTNNGVSVNQELQIARIIQAVVNTAPMDAEVQVEINPTPQSSTSTTNQPSVVTTSTTPSAPMQPNELTINVHLGDIGFGNMMNSGGSNQPRVTTVTLPTTSTQTRSTARQQMHTGNLPIGQLRNFRPTTDSIFSAFDRFLPCNSHHIRDAAGNLPGARVQQQPAGQSQPTWGTSSTPQQQNNSAPPDTTNANSTQTPPQSIRIPVLGNSFDFLQILNFHPQLLNELRNQLQTIVRQIFYHGEAVTQESTIRAVDVFISSIDYILAQLPQIEDSDYDVRASIENLLRAMLPRFFETVMTESTDQTQNFQQRISQMFTMFNDRVCRILFICIGRQNSQQYLNQVTRMTIESQMQGNLEETTMRMMHQHLASEFERVLNTVGNVNRDDIQEYLVIRARAPPAPAAPSTDEPTSAGRTEVEPAEPMETDEIAPEEPPCHSQATMNVDVEPPMPPATTVDIEPQPWHRNFPRDWIPIISQDVQKQRRQPEQLPFSDAYLSGMSSKRRKMITCSKPSSDIQEVLNDSVRHAIKSTGLTRASSTSIDEISRTIASDSNVQSAYQEEMKATLGQHVKNHPDYKPDRFPSSSKYFK